MKTILEVKASHVITITITTILSISVALFLGFQRMAMLQNKITEQQRTINELGRDMDALNRWKADTWGEVGEILQISKEILREQRHQNE